MRDSLRDRRLRVTTKLEQRHIGNNGKEESGTFQKSSEPSEAITCPTKMMDQCHHFQDPHWEEMSMDHVARWLDVLNSERRDLALEYKLLEEEGLEFPQLQIFVTRVV